MEINPPQLVEQENNWDMVIQPQRGLLDLRLGELWRYKDLVLLFVRRDFVSVYKQTILGPLWYLIQPLLTTITFTVIFGNIASLPTDGLPQFLFYMSGTVVWSYFASCLTKTSETFVQNANLFGKVYFPRLAVPVSILISNLITFLIQFAMFLVFVLYFILRGTPIQFDWLWIALSPILMLMMAGLGLGFGILRVPDIREPLVEQQRKDILLVIAGIHQSAQDDGRPPQVGLKFRQREALCHPFLTSRMAFSAGSKSAL